MKCVTWFLLLTISCAVLAQSPETPKQLQQWAPWVSHQQEFNGCPYYHGQKPSSASSHICAWPHELVLDIKQTSASFLIQWEVIEDSWVPLPGDQNSWPQQLRIDNTLQVVQNRNNKPWVYLPAGRHEISGNFLWQARPETLQIPAQIAGITLTLNGKSIQFPEKRNSYLWLGETKKEDEVESNALEIDVNRLIIDDHPMTMFVSIQLAVSGTARNEKIGKMGSADMRITHLISEIPAYVDADGFLWAQLKPGNWEMNLNFNMIGWPEKISFDPNGEFWPQQEIWAYQDNKNIRITQVEGVTPINPEQSFALWDQVPNYLVNAGDEFIINEQKRGTLNQSEQLDLYRQLWLSFDGSTYRAKDQIVGGKLGSWRLDAQPAVNLLHATTHGEAMLITQGTEQQQGLELRKPSVDLIVNSEFNPQALAHISGWQASFDRVRTQLHLPYGYMALAASQVDKAYNVWAEKWRLIDIFLVMLLTAITFKMIGLSTAVIAFFALTLGYHEYEMPLIAWTNLMLAVALLSIKPIGWLKRIINSYLWLSLIGLVLVLTPFLINQIRLSLYPQLENSLYYTSSYSQMNEAPAQVKKKSVDLSQIHRQTYNRSNAIEAPQVTGSAEADMVEQSVVKVTGSRIRNADVLNRYQTGSVIQAGKGIPSWNFNSIRLEWDGPVSQEQQFDLFLLTPTMRVLWRIALVIASVYWLLQLVLKMRRRIKPKNTAAVAAQSQVLLSLILLLGLSQPLIAQDYPSDALLAELKKRIYQPAECVPNCISTEYAQAVANGKDLKITVRYHALDAVAVPLPTSSDWRLTQVSIDKQVVKGIIHHQNHDWVALEPGVHTIIMTGQIANRNNISIRFKDIPGYVETQSDDWQFAGLDGHRLSNNALQLIATSKSQQSNETSKSTDFDPFVKVQRYFYFDDQWRMTTRIERIAPEQGVINVSIPLINNESPLDKLQISNSQVLVNLGPKQTTMYWQSSLKRTEKLSLKAAEKPYFVEEWRVISSPQWNLTISGTPLIAPEGIAQDMDDYFEHIFMPRPNEVLEISITRPESVAGEIISVDSVKTVYSTGKRFTKANMDIRYKATQGGVFEIQLDKTAVIKKVTYDNIESNLINEDGLVSVSFLPGSHSVSIEWHQDKSLGIIHKTPDIQLSVPFTNLEQKVQLPRSRWLLWGKSVGNGPAFLYWGELLAFIIIAFFLARVRYSPLNFWQWVLLGFAFGTVSWKAFIGVAVWLFFIRWKKQFKGFETHGNNMLLQYGTLFFSAIAIISLIVSVTFGLFSDPNMGIIGQNSSAYQLNWYQDIGLGSIPTITLLSVPLWWYKSLILLWSIWISFAVIKWIKEAFSSFKSAHWWFKTKPKKAAKNSKKQAVGNASEDSANSKHSPDEKE